VTLPRLVAWRRTDESAGHSVARVEAHPQGGWMAYGDEVLATGPDVLGCWFQVGLLDDWTTYVVNVVAFGAAGTRMRALRVEDGAWELDGEPAPYLDGCLDVDVAATPLTNTFPIRRYADLAVGERRTAPVAWVAVPSLEVTRVEQTYERLGADRWRYSDPDHGAFELVVDEDGLVVDYEGFATRL
jgi:uncharacterized protein